MGPQEVTILIIKKKTIQEIHGSLVIVKKNSFVTA